MNAPSLALRALLLATSLLPLSACSSGGGGGPAAPSGLSYSSPVVYFEGTAITDNIPTVTGTVDSYGVAPALPAGLALDTTTGTISGTPTAVTAAADYTVTATNTVGSTTFDVNIAVEGAPSALSYATPVSYVVGIAITPNAPTSTGTITSYAVAPALPADLALDPTSGIITGTPTVASASAIYTVTGTNPVGSTTADIDITVTAGVVPPTGLAYSESPANYTVGVAITDNVPSVLGVVDSWTVIPALPAGLSLDTVSGVISGTPTTATAQATYTITATNTAGFDTVPLDIAVMDAQVGPSNLSYAQSNPTYGVGILIDAQTPTYDGTADNFAVSGTPALPDGLVLDSSTGEISGTPTTPTVGAVAVTIEASLSGGTPTTTAINITVSDTSPRALYVANNGAGTIGIYLIEPDEGYLVGAGHVSTGDFPLALTLSPDRDHLYAINAGSETLSAWDVDAATGGLTEIAGSPFALAGSPGLSPKNLTCSADGRFLYVANRAAGSISGFAIQPDGSLVELLSSPFGTFAGVNDLVSLTAGAQNLLYIACRDEVTDQVQTLAIAADGGLSAVDTDTAGTTPHTVTLSPNKNFLYVGNRGSNDVSGYVIAGDGTLSELSAQGSPWALVGLGSQTEDLAAVQTGGSRYLYAGDANGLTSQYQIQLNGTLTFLTPQAVANGGSASRGIAVDPGGAFAYAVDNLDREIACWTVEGDGTLSQVVGLPMMRTHAAPTAAVVLSTIGTPDWSSPNVFASNWTDGDVSQFAAAGDGSLTALAPPNAASGTSSSGLDVAPDGDTLYVANYLDVASSIATFPIGAGGALGSPTLTSAPMGDAFDLQVDPSGTFLYVLGRGNGTVTPYPIQAGGTLGTALASVATGAGPRGMAIDPTGQFLYTGNSAPSSHNISQFQIGLTDGLLALGTPATVALTSNNPFDVAAHPSGRFVYSCQRGAGGPDAGDLVSAFAVDPATGALTALGTPTFSTGTDPSALAITPDGRYLYVATRTGGSLAVERYIINTNPTNANEDGILQPFPAIQVVGGTPAGLALSAAGDVLYVTMEDASGTVEAYSIGVSGTLTPLDSDVTGDSTRNVTVRTVVQ